MSTKAKRTSLMAIKPRIKARNKLGNREIVIGGEQYDSQAEATRHAQLKLLERAGQIYDLERQKKYELIPAYFEDVPTGGFYSRGARKGQPRYKRVCIERGVDYIADFAYTTKDGATVVEDVKGYRDPASAPYAKYVIKRKIMLHKYGIKIKEVRI